MKVLLVDDHALIRDAMRGVIAELRPGAAVLEASSYAAGISLIEQTPDLELVMLDIGLPDGSGFEVLEQLRESHPAISVVMLSGMNDRDSVVKALDKGALGFIPKSGSREVLINALRLILAGGIYIPPEILIDSSDTKGATEPGTDRQPVVALGLTPRQVEVLALMMQGKSNKLICRALNLAEPTVKNHVSAIFKALGVANRTEAALAAMELDWGTPKSAG